MTRGRVANTAHLVASDPAEAREQWIAVFGRDRADLGPAHAADLAAREAANYATIHQAIQPTATPPRPSVRRPEEERIGPSITRRSPAPGIGR